MASYTTINPRCGADKGRRSVSTDLFNRECAAPPAGGLFYGILQCFCRAELCRARSRDTDGLAGARVASFARRACLRREDAEAGDRDFVAGLQARDD